MLLTAVATIKLQAVPYLQLGMILVALQSYCTQPTLAINRADPVTCAPSTKHTILRFSIVFSKMAPMYV